MASYALDREVPPLKTRCCPEGAENITFKAQTTQTSFSSRWKGRSDFSAATPSASRRSCASSRRNASGIYERPDLLSHPRRKLCACSDEFPSLTRRELLSKGWKPLAPLLGAKPREGADDLACGLIW